MFANKSYSKGKAKIGIIQLRCTADKNANYDSASYLIKQAASQGAKVVFLPECCDYVSESKEQALELAETLDGPLITKYKSLAKELSVWMSLGGIHEKRLDDPKRTSNCHVIINSDGDIVSTYHKVHLFDLDIPGKIKLKETNFTVPGEKLVLPVPSPAGSIGMGIVSFFRTACVYHQFPGISEWLRLQGAHILTYPSTFTIVTGRAHWHTLMKSRAIETQSYVISAAQEGQHNAKRSSYGHSIVVDPWGSVLVDLETKTPSFGVVDIDLDFLNTKRIEMPVDVHRRDDLYGSYGIISESEKTSELEQWIGLESGYFNFGPDIKIEERCLFFQTKRCVAFVNLKPVRPGHVLISPKRIAAKFTDLSAEEISDLWSTAQKVQKIMETEYATESSTLAIQDGPEAGQSIPHVHIHVIPRKSGDFPRTDDVYTELEKHDKDENRPARTMEEMEAEAQKLRKYFYKN
ncbi:DgyrCDS5291 [Dimorphilus gyrociliatus]|uniref:bis(5'-adenosyl)-triphosphatase n=1 Tax=Dimorphilus gyrociliatus TaxID=2664684 RepID=A0A7I8VM52_9ANNE|nr:DgyrCDS5291 [Dimorphilus gyrociliatus]